ncbi:MAG: hypothetical protein J2P26_02610 [Nocardiopsaceae bacterium]|nr:hypothetical protein [Nocardiopsaceae bacterium]
MTAFDKMDSDEAANMLEACCILLEPGAAQALSEPALAELRTIRDRAAARLGQHIEAVTGPGELEARWTRGDSDPPVEDDHLRPPGTD